MTEQEAQEIVRMVEVTWRMDLKAEGRVAWRRMLYPYDPEIATRALAELSAQMNERPYPADLRSRILKVKADRATAEAKPLAIDAGKRGTAAPEWVWVWNWARSQRDPRLDTPFPQQRDWVDPRGPMLSTTEYEAVREEWLAAGAPRASSPLPSVR